jgi:hypothetical protein
MFKILLKHITPQRPTLEGIRMEGRGMEEMFDWLLFVFEYGTE